MLQGRQQKKNKEGLQIIVVGCGKVGSTLVEKLVAEGHDITVVDEQARIIAEVTDKYDVMGIEGNGGSLSVLQEAGLAKADVLISVTGSDELNLLCCTLARKVGNRLAAIARVRNPDYSEELAYLRRQLGLALIINPEMEAAKQIAHLVSRPQALTVTTFAKGHAELVRFKIPKGNILNGKRIMDLEKLFGFGYLVCAVERGGEVTIPRGMFELREGDDISVLAKARDVHRVFESIGMKGSIARNCMIVGGGRASYYLARLLLDQRMEVKIIEKNRERCETLTKLLPRALIINGDGSNEQLLVEEGIEQEDAFAALTGIDEENILMSLYAKRIDGIKTITKINRITFNDVIETLELGSVVYPKYIIAEMILAYVRARANSVGSNVETLYHMFDNRVEAIEFHIEKGARVVGVPLMQLKLKEDLLIACVNRNGKVFFPRGQDTLEPEDSVIIVTSQSGFSDVNDILR